MCARLQYKFKIFFIFSHLYKKTHAYIRALYIRFNFSYFLLPKMISKKYKILMNTFMKSVYIMKAQYNDVFLSIPPCSAIFLILHKSNIVTNNTNANIPNSTTQYNGVKTIPVNKIISQLNKKRIPTPALNPMMTIISGAMLPFDKKAIKLIRAKAKAVTPKAMPINRQSTTMVSIENNIPTKTV